jgi:poly-gamma-glutamate synthesis protein (capsule biosynthesis protein)
MDAAHAASRSFREIQALHPNWVPDFDSLYNFPEDSRMTLLVQVSLDPDNVGAVALRPAWINRDAQPRLLAPHEAEFTRVTEYLNTACQEAHLLARFIERNGQLELREIA